MYLCYVYMYSEKYTIEDVPDLALRSIATFS